MKRYIMGSLAGAYILGLTASPVHAFHCPVLVKECRALVAKAEQRADTNKKKLAKASQGCEEALRLHKAGKHKASIIKAGQAITLAGKATKSPPQEAGSSGNGGGY